MQYKKSALLIVWTLLLFCSNWAMAQLDDGKEGAIVEISGMIFSKDAEGRYQRLPYITVGVKGRSQGTYANHQGMFTLVVKKGSTLVFSGVGFKKQEITVPADLKGLYHTITVEMQVTEVDIDEVVVFPWPDRDNLRAEFLAMSPSMNQKLENIAGQNLERRRMQLIAANTTADASELSQMYLQQQARDYGYMGQLPAMNIGNVAAWYDFLSGFKKKKPKEENLKKFE